MAAPSVAATATHLDHSPVSASGRSVFSLNSNPSSPQLFSHNSAPIKDHVLHTDDGASAFESLMLQAYGEPLASGEELDSSYCWYNHWLSIVHLSGKVYSLPAEQLVIKYVDHLSNEVS